MKTKKRVLIIDDDQDLLEIYGFKFLKEGFEVEKANNGAWGLKKVNEEKFDLVLLDMAMPAMNGLEMLKAMDKKKKKQGTPKILVLSNTALDSEIEEMKKAGADGCYVKIKVTPAEVCNEAYKILSK